jgi:DNA repair exonuclease SbcCD ATPase subunit
MRGIAMGAVSIASAALAAGVALGTLFRDIKNADKDSSTFGAKLVHALDDQLSKYGSIIAQTRVQQRVDRERLALQKESEGASRNEAQELYNKTQEVEKQLQIAKLQQQGEQALLDYYEKENAELKDIAEGTNNVATKADALLRIKQNELKIFASQIKLQDELKRKTEEETKEKEKQREDEKKITEERAKNLRASIQEIGQETVAKKEELAGLQTGNDFARTGMSGVGGGLAVGRSDQAMKTAEDRQERLRKEIENGNKILERMLKSLNKIEAQETDVVIR